MVHTYCMQGESYFGAASPYRAVSALEAHVARGIKETANSPTTIITTTTTTNHHQPPKEPSVAVAPPAVLRVALT